VQQAFTKPPHLVGSENAFLKTKFRKFFIFVDLYNFDCIRLCILMMVQHAFTKNTPHFSIAQKQGQNGTPFLKIFNFQKNAQFCRSHFGCFDGSLSAVYNTLSLGRQRKRDFYT